MIPDDRSLVNALTPQQRRVWQRLRTAEPDALTPEGLVRADWLARAWGDPTLPGAYTLLYVTIHNLNRRLTPYGLRLRGSHRLGGYRLVRLESEAVQ